MKARRILERAKRVRESCEVGEFKSLLRDYNQFIADEKLVQFSRIEFNENTDAVWLGNKIVDQGVMKLSMIISNFEELLNIKPTNEKSSRAGMKYGWILAIGGVLFSGVIVWSWQYFYQQGAQSQIRLYDKDKRELSDYCDSLKHENMSLKSERNALRDSITREIQLKILETKSHINNTPK